MTHIRNQHHWPWWVPCLLYGAICWAALLGWLA